MGKQLSRRTFLKQAGLTGAGLVLASCVSSPTDAGAGDAAPAAESQTVTVGVGSWAEESTNRVVSELGFIDETGIEVEVLVRPTEADEFLPQMTGAIQSGTSPYDLLDYQDEMVVPMPRAGWMLPLDDLLPDDFWDDWPQGMIDAHETWNKYEGQSYRIYHNWETQYSFYRGDWFEEQGINPPETWDDMRALGAIFTDEDTGVSAVVDGLGPPTGLGVYLQYTTRQAGGNLFDVGEEYRVALQFVYDLMHEHNTLSTASMQKDYPQMNADFMADRVAYMRQWPFFHSVARANEEWFSEEKVQVALPPVGPGGASQSTYAAAWGYGIVETAPNLEAAQELLTWIVSKEIAAEAAQIDYWWLSSRTSVLEAVQGEGLAGLLEWYTEEGVITTRPFHPKFTEATINMAELASAYFTDQMGLDECMDQTAGMMASL